MIDEPTDTAQRLAAELENAADDRERVARCWTTLDDPELDQETRKAYIIAASEAGIMEARERYVEELVEEIRGDHSRRLDAAEARVREVSGEEVAAASGARRKRPAPDPALL